MHLFRRIVLAAAAAGVLAGLLLSALDFLGTVPLIRAAEQYEATAPAHAGHDHLEQVWAPRDGFERSAYTVVVNLTVGIGFALLLCAIFAQRVTVSWREGVAWGLAGFAVFVLSPSLGLPPVPPGVPESPLGPRQAWWLLAALCTAVALCLLAFTRGAGFKAAGVVLLVLPHLIGAPQPEYAPAATPESLVRRFAMVSVLTNAAFWVALGPLCAWWYRRIH